MPPLRCVLFACFAVSLLAAPDFDVQANYTKTEYHIPMRDGIELYTAVYSPKQVSGSLPILLTRTPYSAGPYGPGAYRKRLGPLGFAEEKFIFVWQDVRGRFESQGEFVDVRPVKENLAGPNDTDETSDTYDTIDWLIKNLPGNNGKVGMIGTSYDGFYTTSGLIRAHPALVAASPQAPMADLYHGDDAYHNGAFFLIANFSFYTDFNKQHNPENPAGSKDYDYGTPDGYRFYLEMGPLANSERLLPANQYWNDMYRHTAEDDFWKARNILPHLKNITPAVLVVGGWFDAEDLSGALKTYQAIRAQSPQTLCTLAMGPWPHGGWNLSKGDKLGDIAFDANTAEDLRALELTFFKQHLKSETPAQAIPGAFLFETGSNQWRRYDAWPIAGTAKRLYLEPHGQLAFEPPEKKNSPDKYVSDPAKPVPYSAKPTLEMERTYMDADQRFAASRKDVISYVSKPLEEDLAIAGPVSPTLFVSTSGTDSDFDVKLIDVLPSGYQQLVRGEPFRGKFRESFEHPQPFQPGQMTAIQFAMPGVFHCFRKGHRIMVQVQSSWFPLTDRNPQTFTDIPSATADQFVKASQKIYHQPDAASYLEVTAIPTDR